MVVGFYLAFFALIFGLIKYVYQKNVASKVEDLVPVVYAVVNHGRDTVSQIKPAVNNYVEKHQTTNLQTSNIQSISNTVIAENDEMYAVAMEEIENGTVQKGLYARAFSQSEGDKNKTDALYIKFRVQSIKDEYVKLKNTATFDSNVVPAKVISTVNQELEKRINADKRAQEVEEELKIWRKKEQKDKQQIEEERIQSEKLSTFGIPIVIKQKIENDGYSFLSKLKVREKSTWNDYDFFIASDRVVFKNRAKGHIVKEYVFNADDLIL